MAAGRGAYGSCWCGRYAAMHSYPCPAQACESYLMQGTGNSVPGGCLRACGDALLHPRGYAGRFQKEDNHLRWEALPK